MTGERTAADLIAERLHAEGCRHAFGIPGGEVLALTDALARAGIRVVLARHENCAGFMGEGVHHHDGAPAILFATIGPGLANAANVIANAWQDRVPLIVLTGCVPAVERETYTHQVFDHVKFAETIAKAAFRIEPGTAGIVIDKAVAIATEGRPGPVVVDVPIDVQTMPASHWRTPHRTRLLPTTPAKESFVTATKWLAEAQRPLVIAGLDVLADDEATAVREFCLAANTPLITTYKAKGILPEDHPLALGAAGLSPKADRLLLPLVEQSDCVIMAGYDPIEMRIGWRDVVRPGQRVIDIAARPNTHYMHQAALNVVADIAATLLALRTTLTQHPVWTDGEPARARAGLLAQSGADEPWGPAAVIDEARETLPRDAVISVDSGAHRILLSQNWQTFEPRGVIQSTALCTMGCAVPLAIGRKLAEPDRPVAAFIGDAGLEMFLGELATARDLKLALPVVIFVDQQLGLIELKQRASQLPGLAVEFGATDFPAVARAMGGEGCWVRDRESLNTALNEALARNTFTLIAAVIGKSAYDGRL